MLHCYYLPILGWTGFLPATTMSARLNLMISGTFRPCKKGKHCIAVPSRRSCRTMGRAQASKVARPPMNHLQSPAPQNSTAEAPGMDRCYLQVWNRRLA
ncbi:hypothetical protein FOXYSP1_04038 [Fusarium oxysporum f. sp. phaseoli]